MWSKIFRNKDGYLHPFWARLISRFYGPFFGAGIRIKAAAPDYRYMRVEMPLTWYNSNYVGTQFGGSIYAMTDPFHMLMLIQNLGNDYIVWDKGANIDFLKPGRKRLVVEFRWTEGEIEEVRKRTADGQKYVFDREVLVHDSDGLLVARIIKTLYVRKKEAVAKQSALV